MAPRKEGSHLKRPRGAAEAEAKKPRRSERLSSQRVDDSPGSAAANANANATPRHHPKTPRQQQKAVHLQPEDSSESDRRFKEPTATPPEGRPSQMAHRPGAAAAGRAASSDDQQPAGSNASPPQDTQAFPSQHLDPNSPLTDEVRDEVKEGVWGYLFPLGVGYDNRSVVMKRRSCADDAPVAPAKAKGPKPAGRGAAGAVKSSLSGGYLIGRHPECDVVLDNPIVSNRHCLIFAEHKGPDTVAVLEDLSSNGTFVNEALVGRNQRRELQEKDEIAVLDKARFVFRYPRSRTTSAFSQQFTLLDRLGKGHFAEVYLCIEKATGKRYAVKIFTKTPGVDDRSKTEGLQQEIAVLMGVNHPCVLCLKDTFNEKTGVYLVLELAPEGELFNYIVMNQKLSEDETRKLFKQLFEGVKYLHDRNIVHRDIKPENILLVDRDLHVKLADFGLAKIIGEDSFTTTLCGTPSYVAPEILGDSRQRKYTKAVDIWSLGVVLYICLCGFPPFSDDLTSPQFPYTLSQQIRTGSFNYPSPYWDPIGDPALDLIDSMLVVNPERRFTIDQCMAHPWMKAGPPAPNDSTDGLVGGVADLHVDRRADGPNAGLAREKTMLSAINRVGVTHVAGGQNHDPIKIFSKNPRGVAAAAAAGHRADGAVGGAAAAGNSRDPALFVEMGEGGDPVLFNFEDTVYSQADITAHKKGAKGKGKAKNK